MGGVSILLREEQYGEMSGSWVLHRFNPELHEWAGEQATEWGCWAHQCN